MSDVPPPGWDGPPPPPQPFGEQRPAPIWPAADPPAPTWSGGPPRPPTYGPGWSPSGQAPPPYGYTPYDPYGHGGGNMRAHPRGTLVLVFGILGLCGVACFVLFPFGIAAWALGQTAMNQIRADPTTTYTNRGNVNAGRICGIVATVHPHRAVRRCSSSPWRPTRADADVSGRR